ncbi:MAG: hypothetical protein EBY34_03620 [Alphaproteobacteria bacterium]|nr:hypothetical protein [Alphaproteobacteria bacterium]
MDASEGAASDDAVSFFVPAFFGEMVWAGFSTASPSIISPGLADGCFGFAMMRCGMSCLPLACGDIVRSPANYIP